MKKRIYFLLAGLMLMSLSFSSLAIGSPATSVYVDGTKVNFAVPPMVQDGRTLVPMREIFEAFNCNVTWNEATQAVTAYTQHLFVIELQIGKPTATTYFQNFAEDYNFMTMTGTVEKGDLKTISLDVPAQIINGRTMVPLRFIGEAIGSPVDWDPNLRHVYIGDCEAIKAELAQKGKAPNYDNILFANGTFIDAATQKTATIWSLPQVNSDFWEKPVCYTKLDLDQDVIEELVIEYYSGILVLHPQDGSCYGYYMPLRGMNELKTDGTFSASSSAFESYVSYLRFGQNEVLVGNIVSSDTMYNVFLLNGEPVSKDKCDAAFQEFFAKPDVEWTYF